MDGEDQIPGSLLPAFLTMLLIPSLLAGYGIFAMGIGINIAGVAENAAFIILFLLVQYMSFLLPGKISFRVVLSAASLFFFCAFYFIVVLYYRFFVTWPYFDIIYQVPIVPSIIPAAYYLMQPSDVVFLFIVPFMVWCAGLKARLRSSVRISGKALLLVFLIGILLTTVHGLISSPAFLFAENNPFFSFFRRKMRQNALKEYSETSLKDIARDADKYRNINSSLYRPSGNPLYPFENYPLSDTLPSTKRPNVVLIILESQRAYESGAYGAMPSFTPRFDALANEGMLFKDFYANTTQTVKSEFTLLHSFYPSFFGESAYVSAPGLSIVSLPHILKKHGYSTLWISGYSSGYCNKKEFLERHGVDAFYDDVRRPERLIGWGPSDEDIFDNAWDILSRQREPFFAEIMTLSNHYPFNYSFPTNQLAPLPPPDSNAMYGGYARGMYYTDYALGKFFDKIRGSGLADNTIFIVTADHGIWLFPGKQDTDTVIKREIYFRMPLLFWSPRLIKPQVNATLGSQIDVAPTILDMLRIYEINSFLGTSLLRSDTGPRSVLMLHEERWNLRKEFTYVYDDETELFKEHFPQASAGKFAHFTAVHHRCFVANGDLLRVSKFIPDYYCPAATRFQLESLTNRAIDAFLRVLYCDRISKR